MWSVKVTCTNPGCGQQQLTGAGIYKRVRQVLDIDGYYHLATEYLECGKCHKKYIGWSGAVLQQLALGLRCQFPAILTYRYACDTRVIRLLRERGLGNSATRLQKQLQEQHSEQWLQQVASYLTASEPFAQLVQLRDPPPLPHVPTYKWLLKAYAQDILLRIDSVKAKITSTYGSILKMDSTKKVTLTQKLLVLFVTDCLSFQDTLTLHV